MADERIRRQIALLAARLMYAREESEYFTAKRKAARQLGVECRFRPKDLPSNREIRDHIQAPANLYEGDARQQNDWSVPRPITCLGDVDGNFMQRYC